MPADYGQNNDLHVLSQELRERNLTIGYASFWQSNAISIISNYDVDIRCIEITENNGYIRRDYQSSPSWYQPDPTIKQSFLLVTNDEYKILCSSEQWKNLQNNITDSFTIRDYQIIVFDKNLF